MSDVLPSKFVFRSADKGPEQLHLNVWGGRLDLAVFSGQGGAPIFKKSMPFHGIILLSDFLKAALDSQPGSRQSMTFGHYDKDSKSRVTDGTLIVGKNDKQAIFAECQFMHNGNRKQLMFNLNINGDISMGVEPMSEAARSAVQVRAVILWLNTQAPEAMLLTNKKFEPNQQGGGNRGGSRPEAHASGGDFGDSNDVAF
jgi:hypothetical protein